MKSINIFAALGLGVFLSRAILLGSPPTKGSRATHWIRRPFFEIFIDPVLIERDRHWEIRLPLPSSEINVYPFLKLICCSASRCQNANPFCSSLGFHCKAPNEIILFRIPAQLSFPPRIQ